MGKQILRLEGIQAVMVDNLVPMVDNLVPMVGNLLVQEDKHLELAGILHSVRAGNHRPELVGILRAEIVGIHLAVLADNH